MVRVRVIARERQRRRKGRSLQYLLRPRHGDTRAISPHIEPLFLHQ